MAIVTPTDPKASQTVPAGLTERQGPTSVEAASVEIPPATEVPSPKEDPALSSKFAILAKREKAIRAKQREVEERERSFKAQEETHKSALGLKDRLVSDPINTLSELGISYDQLTQLIINSKPEDQALRELKREIQSIKEVQTKAQSEYEAKQTQGYQQAVNQIRTDVKLLVDSDPQFETIKEMGAQESVVSLIEETFKETGRVLSNEEAMTQVENFLIAEGIRMANLNKIKAKLAPPQPDPVAVPTQPKQGQKTLSNSTLATTTKPLSDKDRRLRAIAAFKGQLT